MSTSFHSYASSQLPHCSPPPIDTDVTPLPAQLLQTRKRRREAEVDHPSSSESFKLRPHPHSHLDRLLTAWPQLLLSRAQLPLSFLHPNSSSSLLPKCRFFSAHINALEARPEIEEVETLGPSVLVARLESDGLLYAIERVDENLYSVCGLGTWVGVERLQKLALKNFKRTRILSDVNTKSTIDEWWKPAIVDRTSHSVPRIIRREEDLPSAQRDRTPSVVGVNLVVPIPEAENGGPQSFMPRHEDVAPDDSTTHCDPQEVYANIVSQYLDALYRSKTSLAYFAKGPLSRARAAFKRREGPHLVESSKDLANFLRSIVLTPAALDKKYKITMPQAARTAIESATTVLEGSDNRTNRSSMRRKPRKLKQGKDGLFPDEGLILAQWCHGNDSEESSSFPGDAFETQLRARIAQLRFRDNLLQLVLVLETLALEAASNVTEEAFVASREQETGKTESTTGASSRDRKESKARDFVTLVDTLVDRLTIWQSVSSIEDTAETDKRGDALNADEDIDSSTQSGDQLKDFCLEVVIPFYSSRLPHHIEKLARKLGVSSYRSPAQPKHASSARRREATAPGTEVTRDQNGRHRRPLIRVATGNARSFSAQVPSLVRSATDSFLQEVKRERSTTPATSFNSQHEKRTFSRSSSINQAKTLNQREVNLSAIAKFNEAKSRKKLTVEQELHEAIAALKKPNRGLAVKEYMDAADSRKSGSNDLSQRRTTFSQRSNDMSVQVNATPKRPKPAALGVAATPRRAVLEPVTSYEDIVPSTNPFVTSSVVRPTTKNALFAAFEKPPSTFMLPRLASHISSPSRGPDAMQSSAARVASPVAEAPQLVSSSCRRVSGHDFKVPEPKTVLMTPSKRGILRLSPEAIAARQAAPGMADPSVLATPSRVRRRSSLSETTLASENPLTSKQRLDMSIYDGLGWDAEDY